MKPVNCSFVLRAILAGSLLATLFQAELHAQFTGSSQTNIISGVISNWDGDYHVGDNSDFDMLQIIDGAALYNVQSIVGYSGKGNSVLVSGVGSLWSSDSYLFVGIHGNANLLVIRDGGIVAHYIGEVGVFGSNNSVRVTGSGSIWSNQNGVYVGNSGNENSLIVSNGGSVLGGGVVGFYGDGNSALVTGNSSVWDAGADGAITVGSSSNSNSLVIDGGGAALDDSGWIGINAATNNSVLVTGCGSVWSNQSFLLIGLNADGNAVTVSDGAEMITGWGAIGYGGSNNALFVDGGAVVSSNLLVGLYPNSANNLLALHGGSVIVTNAAGDGALEVNWGMFTFNGGTVTVDQFAVANGPSSAVKFSTGTLVTKGTVVSNDQAFVIGDGTNAATFHLAGGIHSFANGLEVRSNSVLSGCGTINGTVVVDPGGTVLADCGGVLTLAGGVTNNGLVHVEADSMLESYGPVVNNGIIDIMDGATNFHAAFSNNGSIVDATYFRAVSITRQGNNIKLAWTTVGGRGYAVQAASVSYTNSFVDLSPLIAVAGSNLGVTNYLDSGGATNVPAHFYRVRLVP